LALSGGLVVLAVTDDLAVTQPMAAAFVHALVAQTDMDRLDFARWAVTQPPPPIAVRKSDAGAFAGPEAVLAAARAFVLRNDGTVSHPPPWPFLFDPCFPDTGWDAWEAAAAMVQAMAASLATKDQEALIHLAPAFERMGPPIQIPRVSPHDT
jgi:hypothetical protein